MHVGFFVNRKRAQVLPLVGIANFKNHGADFGAKSAEEYAGMASGFFKEAGQKGYAVKVDSKGVSRIYDAKTNTFGSYNPNGTGKTFFKPTSASYFDRQPGELISNKK